MMWLIMGMSASYVRSTIRSWAQMISGALNVQFYDTVNLEQDPQDATWWTVRFIAENMTGTTFCGPGYLETGAIEVMVCAQPGIGDDPAVSDLEAIIREFYKMVDPTQRLVLAEFDPVLEDSLGSATRYYRVGAFITYKLSL